MKNLLIFVAGAAAGSVVTWKLIEKYYKELADEEIESVIETFKNREKEIKEIQDDKTEEKVEKTDNTEKNKEDKDISMYNAIIKNENYSQTDTEIDKMPDEFASVIIIHPNDYGDMDGYDTKSWMLWANGILTNENDEIVPEEEISTYIGDALSHFGDYEDDSVYVRNRANQTDYEILKTENIFEN